MDESRTRRQTTGRVAWWRYHTAIKTAWVLDALGARPRRVVAPSPLTD